MKEFCHWWKQEVIRFSGTATLHRMRHMPWLGRGGELKTDEVGLEPCKIGFETQDEDVRTSNEKHVNATCRNDRNGNSLTPATHPLPSRNRMQTSWSIMLT